MRFARELRGASLIGVALALSVGCGKKKSEPKQSAAADSASSVFKPAAPIASGLPGVAEVVSKSVNPDNEPAYAGPMGSVHGIVTATGDEPPVATAHLAKIKGACPDAREVYGHIFRQGMLRCLPDVLVAVTGYTGYVPAKEPKQTVAARGCAFSTRTVALTFGQTLDVVSKDSEGYAPNLLGSQMKAQLLALPGGAPSTLYPPQPGHYILTDDLKVFMAADVFVLKYATHDVTTLDGHYEIKGIPAGKVRISALLPATQAVVEKDIELKAGESLELGLTLPFDLKAFDAAPAASASAAPAPPAPSSKH